MGTIFTIGSVVLAFAVLTAILLWLVARDVKHIRVKSTENNKCLGDILDRCSTPNPEAADRAQQLSRLADKVKETRVTLVKGAE